jgi:transcriptional repressor NrdR
MVIKKDGSKEMYDRLKLKRAVLLAFAKTNPQNDEIEDMLNILEIKRQSQGNEISSKQIGNDVLELLKKYPVAYVRFASVYKSFSGLEDFKQLLV